MLLSQKKKKKKEKGNISGLETITNYCNCCNNGFFTETPETRRRCIGDSNSSVILVTGKPHRNG